MTRTTNRKWEENGHALACLHCHAGMYWEYQERCWLCIICGYREYEQVLQLRSMAEIVVERVWDEIFGLDEKKSSQKAYN